MTAAILFQYGIMAHAEDFSEGNIHYNILSRTDLTVEVTYEGEFFETQANEYTGKVTIPATVTHNDTTYRVVQIGDDAFNECYNLTSVTLPEGITSIGNAAFRSCDALSAITIPEGVTSIGNGAFYDCGKLTAISLPNSVTTMGNGVFSSCTSLKSVVLSENIKTIGMSVFLDCAKLASINLPEGLTSIGDYAFSACKKLTSITIPGSVTLIKNYAFENCTGLTSISCNATTPTKIGANTFYNVSKSIPVYVPASAISAYQSAANWSAFTNIQTVTYLVTFMIDGKAVSSERLGYGETITAPEAPEREGHTFDGWSDLPEEMPAKDIIVYGTYTPKKYLVTFKIDGKVIAANMQAYGSAIVAPEAPQREGYTFNGWGKVDKTVPAKNVTYSGTYTVNAYTLTYMVDGAAAHTYTLDYGSPIIIPEDPQREGHTFAGWSDELPELMPASDITTHATFTANRYLVTFLIDEEVIAADSLEYGSTIVAPEAPQREGYTFDGWGEMAETVPAKDVTYSGSYTVNAYTLNYMDGDEVIESYTLNYGSPIIIPEDPQREGYTFAGWSTELPELMPANDITTHATFTANKYLVTFIIDEEVIAADSLEYGSTIVAPEAPQREGYTFDGWGEMAETVPADDVTYEGSYSVNIYKVYYYVGEELVYTAEVAYGEAIPEYVYEPTTEGDVFMGWTGELYETMPAHDVTYRANIENGIEQLTIDNAQLTIHNSQFTIDNAQFRIYDLHGRRIQRTDTLTRGVYIVNGRKVVVR